jgi:hypothetical protein
MKDIQYGPYSCSDGSALTIREFKELLARLPESNAEGGSFQIWMETGDGLSSPVRSVWALDRGPDGCDVMVKPE